MPSTSWISATDNSPDSSKDMRRMRVESDKRRKELSVDDMEF